MHLDIDAQARPVGDRRDRPGDRQRLAGDREFVIIRPQKIARIFLDIDRRAGHDQMRHRGRGDVPLEIRADRRRQSIGRGKFGDGPRLADAAVLAGVNADHVAALVPRQLARLRHVEADVIGHDRRRRFAPHARHARIVAIGRRLLHKRQPAIGKRADRRDGCVGIPAAVGIDHKRHVRPGRRAHGTHPGNVAFGVAADFDLDRREAGGDKLSRALGRLFRLVGAQREAAANRQRPAGPAQHFVHGLTDGAALDIPAGHFDGCLGEPVMGAHLIHAPVDLARIGRIAADHDRRQDALDDGPCAPHRLTAPARHDRGLAHSLNARVGAQADYEILGNVVPAQRRDHPPLGLERNANRVGLDVRDLHRRLLRVIYLSTPVATVGAMQNDECKMVNVGCPLGTTEPHDESWCPKGTLQLDTILLIIHHFAFSISFPCPSPPA